MYSKDTQVLTNVGWRYFYELDGTEEVFTWDMETNQLQLEKPSDYVSIDYNGTMKYFENRYVSQLITHDHRMICRLSDFGRSKFSDCRCIEAGNVRTTDSIILPVSSIFSGQETHADAYVLGRAYLDSKSTDGKGSCYIESKSRESCDKISLICSKLDEYTEQVAVDGSIEFSEKIYYNMVHSNALNITEFAITYDCLNWDEQSRKDLIESVIDSKWKKRPNPDNVTIIGDSSILDMTQALCAISNYRTYIKDDRLCICKNENTSAINFNNQKADSPYSDKVYNITTQHGAIVIRRNGKVSIGGSSI